MVGAPEFQLAPVRGPTVNVFSVDGGRSWILRQHLPEGPPLMFFTLMVGTPGYPSAPAKEPAIDVF
jgi:hypothetical protein